MKKQFIKYAVCLCGHKITANSFLCVSGDTGQTYFEFDGNQDYARQWIKHNDTCKSCCVRHFVNNKGQIV